MNWSRSTTFLAALSVAAGLAVPPEARADTPKRPIGHPAQVTSAVKMDISPPLRTITPIKVVPAGKKAPENPPIPKQGRTLGKGQAGADAALQQRPGPTGMPAPIVNIEANNNIFGVYPPDTQGDVGPNHFIQWVNLHFAIYDKTGTSLYGPAAGNTLWSGFGGFCEAMNDGDPQTNYDPLADRWVMSQFALNYPVGPFHQCFAVSQTPDPLGAWYRYDFVVSTTKLNDYPKIGVWPDGYYMTINQFNEPGESWGGLGVLVYERDQMLIGGVARQIYFDVGAVNLNYGGTVPADLDGTPPAPGTPGYVMEWDDSTWLGDPTDTLRIWEVKADWTNPAASTFGLNAAYDPNFMIATADAVPRIAGIPQPGTAQTLDNLADRLMQRLQYRNIGGVGKLTVNHTVDAGGRAGVRWYQLTDPGTGWTMADQGTFAGDPGDTEHRWMGAAALDIQGNLAVGYSVSSSTTFPSIRYNGRLAGDPAGTLGAEASIIVGTGSQLGTAGRWGDYSAMLVDPTDECTFWYTQEYIQTTGGAPWQTRVASFKFPSCVAGPSGTIDGTVKSSAGGSPIPGAHVQVGRVLFDDDQRSGILLALRSHRNLRRDGLQVRLCPDDRPRPGRHRRRHHARRRHPVDAVALLLRRRLRESGRSPLAPLGEDRGSAGRDPDHDRLHVSLERLLRGDTAQRLHLRLHGAVDVSGLPERGAAGHPVLGRPGPELHAPGGFRQPGVQLHPRRRRQRELQRGLPAARLDRREQRLEPQQHLEAERPVEPGEPDGRHGLLGRRRC